MEKESNEYNNDGNTIGNGDTRLESKSEDKPIDKTVENYAQKDPNKMHYNEPQGQLQENIVDSDPEKWFELNSWSSNPFTFGIDPFLFVGYEEQTKELMKTIKENHKLSMILGPTGSGKTTLMKWIDKNIGDNFITTYIGKPPNDPDDFVEIFNQKFGKPWYISWFIPNIKNIHQIPDYLNKKLGNKRLLVLCDEVHETNLEVLEWLRVITDQVDNMSLVVSGLPVFDNILKNNIETFRKRIVTRIELISLTKEDTRKMILKRIENVGGKGIEPFTEETINMIYEKTGGFPREIIRICNDLVNIAIKRNHRTIIPDLMENKKQDTREDVGQVSLNIMDEMTPLQEDIIEMLSKGFMTPGQIANNLDMEKYKSRQHAVRSVNNILKRMLEDELVMREREGRAYRYTLAPKLKTIVVKY